MGFERLFERYLKDINAEINWSKIETLPKEAVIKILRLFNPFRASEEISVI